MDIVSYILSRKYTDNAIVGLGSIRGANCTVDNIVHQDGINTVTFKWTGTDGTIKTRDMVVYDGTPIYVWESGNTYHYGDLAIYESQFYRCITENHDITFDDTKWNEIGSPDGNYDLVQSRALLPARFTAADRKLYFVIDECIFYLWDGTQWVAQTHLVQESVMPTASAKYLGRMYQYIGATDANFIHGYVYECVSDGQTIPTFTWENIEIQPCVASHTSFDNTNSGLDATNVQDAIDEINTIKQDEMQVTTMPLASVDNLGKVYQYIGVETVDYEHGCFYECISDGAVTPTYSWKNIGFIPTFVGTEEQWNALTSAQQNQYDIVNITEDEEIINLGAYLRKVKVMPSADDCPSEVVMYIGATTVDYTRGYIYRSVPSVVSGETVYNWVRQDTQPSHPYVQSDYAQNDSTAIDYIKNKPTLGTASAKNFTDNVRPNSHDLVESNAVYNAISSSIASIYKPHGSLTCAQLTSDLLIAANVGNVYNMTDSGTTSALFIQGAGKTINVNDTVGIIQADNNAIMFNLMGSMIDLHEYQKQELSTPLTIGGVQETDVEDALEALNDVKATQFTTMPTASVDYVNKIVQYVGGNTQTYTNGFWYKCVSDGAVSPTYSWEVINTQNKATLLDVANMYNVLDYGLVGDGVTDNVTALRNLINLVPNGATIYFPTGIYGISDGIFLNKPISLIGESHTDAASSQSITSTIKYIGNSDNVSMFSRNLPYPIAFTNLIFDGNSFDITKNTDEFTTLPYPFFKETISHSNINGIDMAYAKDTGTSATINCIFMGFSGFGLSKSRAHEFKDCRFINSAIGIKTMFDSIITDCWFNQCGSAIKLVSPDNQDLWTSLNVSDCWADQLSRHFIETDGLINIIHLMVDNVWVDMVDSSAFYFPNASVNKSTIQGHFGRIGMMYAGLADADRTEAIAKDSDFIYAKLFTYSTFDIDVGENYIGLGNNPEGKCVSKYFYPTDWSMTGCIINAPELYVSDLMGKGAAYNTKVNCRDGIITIHNNINFLNGVAYGSGSPIGTKRAPSVGYYYYDTTNKITYRSTGNTVNDWEVVIEPIQINTLPTASVDNVGKVYLYTGATTQDYIHGGIYECQEITPSTDPATYHWVLISSADYVTPEQFGAVGDGVTDDSSAFTSAINAARLNGKKLFLSKKYYLASKVTTNWITSIVIEGVSVYNANDNDNAKMSSIIAPNGFEVISNATLKNIMFDGYGIQVIGNKNHICNCMFKTCNKGIEMVGGYGTHSTSWYGETIIDSCYFYECPIGVDFILDSVSNKRYYDCIVRDNIFSRGNIGINGYTNGTLIQNNHIYNTLCINLDGENNIVSENYIDGTETLITMSASGGNIIVHNNMFYKGAIGVDENDKAYPVCTFSGSANAILTFNDNSINQLPDASHPELVFVKITGNGNLGVQYDDNICRFDFIDLGNGHLVECEDSSAPIEFTTQELLAMW